MKTHSNQNSEAEPLPRDLGDGLLLRRATPADAEALAGFNAQIHRDRDAKEPNERVGAWVQDLMSGTHPTFRPEDFTLVEDTRTGDVVVCPLALSQGQGKQLFGSVLQLLAQFFAVVSILIIQGGESV